MIGDAMITLTPNGKKKAESQAGREGRGMEDKILASLYRNDAMVPEMIAEDIGEYENPTKVNSVLDKMERDGLVYTQR